jgi:hypothetical protein
LPSTAEQLNSHSVKRQPSLTLPRVKSLKASFASPSMMKKDKDFSVVVSKKESPMSAKKKVLSWTQHQTRKIIETLVCKILNTKKIFRNR